MERTENTQRHIYLLYTCDVRRRNRTLLAAAVSRKRLKQVCVRALHNDLMEYCPNVKDKKSQVRLFRRDFESLSREQINRKMRYGYIAMCFDGEEII